MLFGPEGPAAKGREDPILFYRIPENMTVSNFFFNFSTRLRKLLKRRENVPEPSKSQWFQSKFAFHPKRNWGIDTYVGNISRIFGLFVQMSKTIENDTIPVTKVAFDINALM